MTDVRERALELLERCISNGRASGDAVGATARECLAAMEGLGYRPTAAQPAADWRLRQAGSEPSEDTRAALEAFRQQCAVSPTRVHPDSVPGSAA